MATVPIYMIKADNIFWKKRLSKLAVWGAAAKEMCSRKRDTLGYGIATSAMIVAPIIGFHYSSAEVLGIMVGREIVRGLGWGAKGKKKHFGASNIGAAFLAELAFLSLLSESLMRQPSLREDIMAPLIVFAPALFQPLVIIANALSDFHLTPKEVIKIYKEMFDYQDNQGPPRPQRKIKNASIGDMPILQGGLSAATTFLAPT